MTANPNSPPPGLPRLMTPHEVSKLFRVDRRTVKQWALAGKVGYVRTPGGSYRYYADDIRAFMNGRRP